jgi:hypothetical protein
MNQRLDARPVVLADSLPGLITAPTLKGFSMFYVICPTCEARVEVPTNAVGSGRTDPCRVVQCVECDAGFDYDDEDVCSDAELQS